MTLSAEELRRKAAEQEQKTADKIQEHRDLVAEAAYLLDKGEFLAAVLKQGKWLVQDNDPEGEPIWVNPDRLGNHYQAFNSKSFKTALVGLMEDRGLMFKKVVMTYDKPPPGAYNLLSIANWVEPDLGATEYHWLYDVFLRALGGKQENVDHLEHVLAWKRYKPEDSHHLPCIIIFGEGGIGKNFLFEGFLAAIFAGQTAIVSETQAMGKFNGIIQGKAAILMDEGATHVGAAMKRTIQSRTVTVEPKGLDPFKANNTALYFVSSNRQTGGVWLDRTNADRRYSVMRVGKPLEYWLFKHHHPDRDDPSAQELEDYRQWFRETGGKILCDKAELAKWLGVIIQKWGDKRIPFALHGEDFKWLLGHQSPIHEQLCKAIFTDPKFTHIGKRLMYKCYLAVCKENGEKRPLPVAGFHNEVTRYIDANKLPIYIHRPHLEMCSLEQKLRDWNKANNHNPDISVEGGTTRPKCYVKTGSEEAANKVNDSKYMESFEYNGPEIE